MMRQLIFDLPAARSTNLMGISTMRPPAIATRLVIST